MGQPTYLKNLSNFKTYSLEKAIIHEAIDFNLKSYNEYLTKCYININHPKEKIEN